MRSLSGKVRKLLLIAARKAAYSAYSPYSGIRVGAAVLTKNDRLFVGCNIENASYGLTICAERVAVQNAVAAGEREMLAVAVFSPDMKGISPCGACRQVMAEFSGPGAVVYLDGKRTTVGALLPGKFDIKGVKGTGRQGNGK